VGGENNARRGGTGPYQTPQQNKCQSPSSASRQATARVRRQTRSANDHPGRSNTQSTCHTCRTRAKQGQGQETHPWSTCAMMATLRSRRDSSAKLNPPASAAAAEALRDRRAAASAPPGGGGRTRCAPPDSAHRATGEPPTPPRPRSRGAAWRRDESMPPRALGREEEAQRGEGGWGGSSVSTAAAVGTSTTRGAARRARRVGVGGDTDGGRLSWRPCRRRRWGGGVDPGPNCGWPPSRQVHPQS